MRGYRYSRTSSRFRVTDIAWLCMDDEVEVAQAVDLQSGELVIRPGCEVAGTRLRILPQPGQFGAEHLLPIVHVHDGACRGLEIKFDETCDDPSEVHREVVHLSCGNVKVGGQLGWCGVRMTSSRSAWVTRVTG